MTSSTTALSRETNSKMTLSIMTLINTTLRQMILGVLTRHDDIQHSIATISILGKGRGILEQMLSVVMDCAV